LANGLPDAPEITLARMTHIVVQNSSPISLTTLYLCSIPKRLSFWHDICLIQDMIKNETIGWDRFMESDYGKWAESKVQELKYWRPFNKRDGSS
jgi:hypothetical protein